MINFISGWKKRKIAEYLEKTDSSKILQEAEKKLIPAFHYVAANVPAYKCLLKEKNVDVSKIKDIKSFKELVPLLNKEIFCSRGIKDLCLDGALKDAKVFSTSSGFSGTFSFAISAKRELKSIKSACDFLLDYNFDTGRKKTLVVNCLAMGVKVYTDLPLAETSVRPDSILALINKFEHEFEQFILIGNPFFLKEVLEEGLKRGIDWKTKNINLVMGEDWFPESFRSYLGSLLGIEFSQSDKRMVGSSMGICELGLSLFQESRHTIDIRRLAAKDEKLRTALFGEDFKTCPLLFHYNPFQIFLEEIDGGLVFSMLNKDAVIPLIRYHSGDRGKIITCQMLKEVFAEFNYQGYLPEIHLPLVAVSGRKDKFIPLGGKKIFPEEIKEALYSDFTVAGLTTGYFHISQDNGRLKLEIQLKEGINPCEEINGKFRDALIKYISEDFILSLYPYREFPYGVGLIYEQKFKYL